MSLIESSEANKIIDEQQLLTARPWEPLTEDYLSTYEFLTVLGIKRSSRKRKEIQRYLYLACSRTDAQSLLPDYLKRVFLDGVVRVHFFNYKKKGPVKFMYRIAVKDIGKEYLPTVAKVIALREKIKATDAIDTQTRKSLAYLAVSTGKNINSLIIEFIHEGVNSRV